MLDSVISKTNEYIDSKSKEERKKYGQFFASKETVVFMSELYKSPKEHKCISILDPGAGS